MKLSEKYFNQMINETPNAYISDRRDEIKIYGEICKLEERMEYAMTYSRSYQYAEKRLNQIAKENNLL